MWAAGRSRLSQCKLFPAPDSRVFNCPSGRSRFKSHHNASCCWRRVLVFLSGLLVDQVSVVTMQAFSRELLQPELFPWWPIFSFFGLCTSLFALRSVFTVTIAVKSGKNYNLLDGDLGSGESGLPPHACCVLNLAVKQSKDTSCTMSTPGPMNVVGVGFPYCSHNVNCPTTRSRRPLREPFCTVNKKLIFHHKVFAHSL